MTETQKPVVVSALPTRSLRDQAQQLYPTTTATQAHLSSSTSTPNTSSADPLIKTEYVEQQNAAAVLPPPSSSTTTTKIKSPATKLKQAQWERNVKDIVRDSETLRSRRLDDWMDDTEKLQTTNDREHFASADLRVMTDSSRLLADETNESQRLSRQAEHERRQFLELLDNKEHSSKDVAQLIKKREELMMLKKNSNQQQQQQNNNMSNINIPPSSSTNSSVSRHSTTSNSNANNTSNKNVATPTSVDALIQAYRSENRTPRYVSPATATATTAITNQTSTASIEMPLHSNINSQQQQQQYLHSTSTSLERGRDASASSVIMAPPQKLPSSTSTSYNNSHVHVVPSTSSTLLNNNYNREEVSPQPSNPVHIVGRNIAAEQQQESSSAIADLRLRQYHERKQQLQEHEQSLEKTEKSQSEMQQQQKQQQHQQEEGKMSEAETVLKLLQQQKESNIIIKKINREDDEDGDKTPSVLSAANSMSPQHQNTQQQIQATTTATKSQFVHPATTSSTSVSQARDTVSIADSYGRGPSISDRDHHHNIVTNVSSGSNIYSSSSDVHHPTQQQGSKNENTGSDNLLSASTSPTAQLPSSPTNIKTSSPLSRGQSPNIESLPAGLVDTSMTGGGDSNNNNMNQNVKNTLNITNNNNNMNLGQEESARYAAEESNRVNYVATDISENKNINISGDENSNDVNEKNQTVVVPSTNISSSPKTTPAGRYQQLPIDGALSPEEAELQQQNQGENVIITTNSSPSASGNYTIPIHEKQQQQNLVVPPTTATSNSNSLQDQIRALQQELNQAKGGNQQQPPQIQQQQSGGVMSPTKNIVGEWQASPGAFQSPSSEQQQIITPPSATTTNIAEQNVVHSFTPPLVVDTSTTISSNNMTHQHQQPEMKQVNDSSNNNINNNNNMNMNMNRVLDAQFSALFRQLHVSEGIDRETFDMEEHSSFKSISLQFFRIQQQQHETQPGLQREVYTNTRMVSSPSGNKNDGGNKNFTDTTTEGKQQQHEETFEATSVVLLRKNQNQQQQQKKVENQNENTNNDDVDQMKKFGLASPGHQNNYDDVTSSNTTANSTAANSPNAFSSQQHQQQMNENGMMQNQTAAISNTISSNEFAPPPPPHVPHLPSVSTTTTTTGQQQNPSTSAAAAVSPTPLLVQSSSSSMMNMNSPSSNRKSPKVRRMPSPSRNPNNNNNININNPKTNFNSSSQNFSPTKNLLPNQQQQRQQNQNSIIPSPKVPASRPSSTPTQSSSGFPSSPPPPHASSSSSVINNNYNNNMTVMQKTQTPPPSPPPPSVNSAKKISRPMPQSSSKLVGGGQTQNQNINNNNVNASSSTISNSDFGSIQTPEMLESPVPASKTTTTTHISNINTNTTSSVNNVVADISPIQKNQSEYNKPSSSIKALDPTAIKSQSYQQGSSHIVVANKNTTTNSPKVPRSRPPSTPANRNNNINNNMNMNNISPPRIQNQFQNQQQQNASTSALMPSSSLSGVSPRSPPPAIRRAPSPSASSRPSSSSSGAGGATMMKNTNQQQQNNNISPSTFSQQQSSGNFRDNTNNKLTQVASSASPTFAVGSTEAANPLSGSSNMNNQQQQPFSNSGGVTSSQQQQIPTSTTTTNPFDEGKKNQQQQQQHKDPYLGNSQYVSGGQQKEEATSNPLASLVPAPTSTTTTAAAAAAAANTTNSQSPQSSTSGVDIAKKATEHFEKAYHENPHVQEEKNMDGSNKNKIQHHEPQSFDYLQQQHQQQQPEKASVTTSPHQPSSAINVAPTTTNQSISPKRKMAPPIPASTTPTPRNNISPKPNIISNSPAALQYSTPRNSQSNLSPSSSSSVNRKVVPPRPTSASRLNSPSKVVPPRPTSANRLNSPSKIVPPRPTSAGRVNSPSPSNRIMNNNRITHAGSSSSSSMISPTKQSNLNKTVPMRPTRAGSISPTNKSNLNKTVPTTKPRSSSQLSPSNSYSGINKSPINNMNMSNAASGVRPRASTTTPTHHNTKFVPPPPAATARIRQGSNSPQKSVSFSEQRTHEELARNPSAIYENNSINNNNVTHNVSNNMNMNNNDNSLRSSSSSGRFARPQDTTNSNINSMIQNQQPQLSGASGTFVAPSSSSSSNKNKNVSPPKKILPTIVMTTTTTSKTENVDGDSQQSLSPSSSRKSFASQMFHAEHEETTNNNTPKNYSPSAQQKQHPHSHHAHHHHHDGLPLVSEGTETMSPIAISTTKQTSSSSTNVGVGGDNSTNPISTTTEVQAVTGLTPRELFSRSLNHCARAANDVKQAATQLSRNIVNDADTLSQINVNEYQVLPQLMTDIEFQTVLARCHSAADASHVLLEQTWGISVSGSDPLALLRDLRWHVASEMKQLQESLRVKDEAILLVVSQEEKRNQTITDLIIDICSNLDQQYRSLRGEAVFLSAALATFAYLCDTCAPSSSTMISQARHASLLMPVIQEVEKQILLQQSYKRTEQQLLPPLPTRADRDDTWRDVREYEMAREVFGNADRCQHLDSDDEDDDDDENENDSENNNNNVEQNHHSHHAHRLVSWFVGEKFSIQQIISQNSNSNNNNGDGNSNNNSAYLSQESLSHLRSTLLQFTQQQEEFQQKQQNQQHKKEENHFKTLDEALVDAISDFKQVTKDAVVAARRLLEIECCLRSASKMFVISHSHSNSSSQGNSPNKNLGDYSHSSSTLQRSSTISSSLREQEQFGSGNNFSSTDPHQALLPGSPNTRNRNFSGFTETLKMHRMQNENVLKNTKNRLSALDRLMSLSTAEGRLRVWELASSSSHHSNKNSSNNNNNNLRQQQEKEKQINLKDEAASEITFPVSLAFADNVQEENDVDFVSSGAFHTLFTASASAAHALSALATNSGQNLFSSSSSQENNNSSSSASSASQTVVVPKSDVAHLLHTFKKFMQAHRSTAESLKLLDFSSQNHSNNNNNNNEENKINSFATPTTTAMQFSKTAAAQRGEQVRFVQKCLFLAPVGEDATTSWNSQMHDFSFDEEFSQQQQIQQQHHHHHHHQLPLSVTWRCIRSGEFVSTASTVMRAGGTTENIFFYLQPSSGADHEIQATAVSHQQQQISNNNNNNSQENDDTSSSPIIVVGHSTTSDHATFSSVTADGPRRLLIPLKPVFATSEKPYFVIRGCFQGYAVSVRVGVSSSSSSSQKQNSNSSSSRSVSMQSSAKNSPPRRPTENLGRSTSSAVAHNKKERRIEIIFSSLKEAEKCLEQLTRVY